MQLHRIMVDGTLELRPLAQGDQDALTRVVLANHAHLAHWLPDIARVQGADDVAAWLRRRLDAATGGDGRYWGIWVRGRLSGVVGFHAWKGADRSASMGCWLAADALGDGVMARAAGALLRHASSELGMRRVEWDCAAPNAASRRLATRLGFTHEGTEPGAALHLGEPADKVTYALELAGAQ